MDLNYLQTEILPVRAREIEEGKNLGTRQPIYVVLDLQENVCSGYNQYSSNTTNYKGERPKFGYIELAIEPELRKFKSSGDGMIKPEEVTLFYTDRIIAFFLTSEAAHAYIQYQAHNMKRPYVYVFYSGYGNLQMDKLLRNT